MTAEIVDINPNERGLAEQALLGRMLLFQEAVPVGLLFCVAEDFGDALSAAAFRAIERLTAAGDPVTIESTGIEVMRGGELKLPIGQVYAKLVETCLVVTGPQNAQHFARIVSELGDRARLAKAASAVVTGRADEESVDDLERALQDLSAARHGRPQRVGEILSHRYDELAAESEGRTETHRIETGFPPLDAMGGMRAGELWLLAARPSVGKTALALQIAVDVAQSGARVLLFSLEMTRGEIADRIFVRGSSITTTRIRSARITPGDWEDLHRIVRTHEPTPLEISDDGRTAITEIVAACEHAALFGHVGLVVVDYVQLVRPSRRHDTREQEVAQVSRELKGLAKSIRCPILALCQLSRRVEMRAGGLPMLSDLRESGSQEQDADAVMFLHRPGAFDTEADATETDLIIAKNRHGPIGKIALRFDAPRMSFQAAPEERTT